VRELKVSFGAALAVRGASFTIATGEAVGLVGESGSGKSVTALSLMGLLPAASACVEALELRVVDCDLLTARARELQEMRGGRAAMIFQDPLTALHPMKRVGAQLGEAIRRHSALTRSEARARSIELMRRVGIPEAGSRIDDYPHEFSGGQRQRIMIAMAISCGPRLLIADEPTTALDVTIQAQILDLMAELRSETTMGLLFITHDLGVIARVCERVVVMYAGRIVEDAPVDVLFEHPRHPYTVGLLASVPRIDEAPRVVRPIPGAALRATERIAGCAFRPRCPHAVERCVEQPALQAVGERHLVACWRSREL